MGFVRERKVYRLVFDGELDGLEVVARSVGLGDYFAISELAGVKLPLSSADSARFRKSLKAFAEALVEWNLEDAPGSPVPATYEGLLSQEPEFVVRVILAWMDAIAGVIGDPLEPSLELPVEPLTP